MFFAFCRLVLERPWVATLSIAALLLVPVPGLSLLAWSLVALLLLRKSISKAVAPCAAGVAALCVLAFSALESGATVTLSYSYDLAAFISVMLAACVLRAHGNWVYAITTVSLLLFVLALYDHFVSQYWQQSANLYLQFYVQNELLAPEQITPVKNAFRQALPTLLAIKAIASLLIARAIQGKLFMPGQFAADFRDIRLPVALSALFAVLLAICYTVDDLLYNAVIVSVPVLFAGVSLVHFFVKVRGLHRFWLVVFYASLAFGFTTFATMIIALLDSVFDLRKRIVPAVNS